MSKVKLDKMQKEIDILQKRVNKKTLGSKKAGNSASYERTRNRRLKRIEKLKEEVRALKSNMKLKNRKGTEVKYDTDTGEVVNNANEKRDFVNRNKEEENASNTRQNNNKTSSANKKRNTDTDSSNLKGFKEKVAKRSKLEAKTKQAASRPYNKNTLSTEKLDNDQLKVERIGASGKKTSVDNLNESVKGGKETYKDTPKRKAAEAMATLESKANKTSKNKDVAKKEEGSFGLTIARMLNDKSNTEDSSNPDFNQEYHNLNKGGTIKKNYGMRAGGFTKRGGMYKKGY